MLEAGKNGTQIKTPRRRVAGANQPILDVGTAPHRPAGHFSPYSDGEKGLSGTSAFFLRRWRLA
ncbi:hypothetical protein L2252_27735, partial [Mesorhizobium muleiense]|nr:hypothetical protein [Mesorhizobium muleiense]